ncbi:MAG: PEP-CTERM-box response regulator transcription factor [Verrucomicrobia bacterium]|nr:PEP-CTERM-box response regulator transcription factor [Verrucomicrobiota bacterium]
MKSKLLIVDDDEEIRTQMKWALSQDYDVILAGDRPSACQAFRLHRPPVALLDLGLPPQPAGTQEGFAALGDMLSEDGLAKVIILTGQGERKNALQAIGSGAFDLLTKPVDLEGLKVILRRSFHIAGLERDLRGLDERSPQNTFEGMLGSSRQMRALFGSIGKVAATDAPVLILGESGTGKEMAALAVHRRSARRNGPFVAINCGAIPENLLESELFGHEKGSFTGAHIQRKGLFECATGGSLFLDEIGEIPLALQVKLLRFLQEQSIERVGGRQAIAVDARVIAATNADLTEAIGSGRFREDLYYRLAVVVLRLPALRDRENDVCLLAQEFLRRSAEEAGKPGLVFDQNALKALSCHPWPGNVRELENRIRRSVIMADGKRLSDRDLELDNHSKETSVVSLKAARESVEREIITQALRKHAGNIAAAAAELGVSRPTVYELMNKLRITKG